MLHSRFNFAVFAPFFIASLLTAVLLFLFPVLIWIDASRIPVFVYCSMLFFWFIWAWIVFGMLRQHTVSAELNDTTIIVRSYLGFGRKRSYDLNSFEGYYVLTVPPWNRHREAVYLKRTAGPDIKLHGHYLKNIEEIEAFISTRVPALGKKDFSQLTEIRDAFKRL